MSFLKHSHPIFSLPSTGPSKQPVNVESGRRGKSVIVRGVDLILAVGTELRITSLVQSKGNWDENDSNSTVEDYKVLGSSVRFPIQQLILNSTSKLLAVVGITQVSIIVLPRKGWNATTGKKVAVKSLPIGAFYHSLPSSLLIAQVSFHEWGDNGSSLLVLTQDGMMREYSVGEDTEEPASVVDLNDTGVAGIASRSRGFSADDEDGKTAVSFCFGDGDGDWGKFTLYGLMRNGDVVAVCPFLPKRALIPSSAILALSHFVSTKVDCLAVDSTTNDPDSTSHSILSNSASTHLDSMTAIYALQLRYINNLVRQVANYRDPLGTKLEDDMDLDPQDRPIKINAPSVGYLGGLKTRRQGPFLMQPDSVELSSEIESFACDLAYISYSSSTSGINASRETNGGALGIFVISYNDGKVDLCLEVEKVEARWLEKNDSRSRVSAETEAEVSPLLIIYETIDLGLLSALEEVSGSNPISIAAAVESNWTTIVKDPLYSDTIYIYHSFGSHCLILSNWLDDLADFSHSNKQDSDVLQKEVERTLKGQKETQVIWILKTIAGELEGDVFSVECLNIINDVYLGYSLVIITEALQLITIELSLRVSAELLPSLIDGDIGETVNIDSETRGLSTEASAYVSVLHEPFIIPAPLDKKAGVSSVPRIVMKASTNQSSAELVITPATLRFLGKTVESFRGDIRSLVTGADVIQRRLELQMKELSTQLGKLKELSNLSNELRKSTASPDGLTMRMDRVKTRQEALLARTDRVLQKLMESHQPIISTFERKWFDELARLSIEILGPENGSARGGERSIVKRVEKVQAQFENLKPGLEALKKNKLIRETIEEKKSSLGMLNGNLGKTQMQKLEEVLSEETRLIVEARRRLDRLNSALSQVAL